MHLGILGWAAVPVDYGLPADNGGVLESSSSTSSNHDIQQNLDQCSAVVIVNGLSDTTNPAGI